MKLHCFCCKKDYSLEKAIWRCDCGNYLKLIDINANGLKQSLINNSEVGFWRYKNVMPFISHNISIGEGITPLSKVCFDNRDYFMKLDYLLPTGSYKDRGVAAMVSQLKQWNLDFVVEDSSGNAGSSVAAYCSKANIKCDVYIPDYTSQGKAAQIEMYGANLVKVAGTREDTRNSAVAAGEKSFYASHNWSPFFEHGVKTYVYEIWEQLNRQLPDIIVAPCGNGSLITSAYIAINELLNAGLASKRPKIVAVQTENCAPLALAWQQGKQKRVNIIKKETIAEGISSAEPLKDSDILEAVVNTNGCFVTVSDSEVWQALLELAKQGILIEPTSATAPAALKKLNAQGYFKKNDTIVVELTGNGLKATDKILKLQSNK